jgi:hypothetical protein
MRTGLASTCFVPLKELSLCGIAVDSAYVAQLKTTFASRSNRRAEQPVPDPQSAGYGVDWDENFAFIAGRTEAGFPYGVTWEEVEAEGIWQEQPSSPNDDEDEDF